MFAAKLRLTLILLIVSVAAGCSGSGSPVGVNQAAVADVRGQYSGTYRLTGCVDDALFVGFCAGAPPAGTTAPIALTLTQNQSAVSGTVVLGSVSGTFQGTVAGATLTGAATFPNTTSEGITIVTAISGWNATVSGNSMNGAFNIVFRAESLTGSATVSATIVQLSR